MRVALFITCVNDTLYPATGRAVVTVLERLGHEVVFPWAQTCCGQMHLNSGHPADAAALARKFARDFADADVVVTPSASCAAMIRDQHPRLAPETAGVAARVHEFTEFLVDVAGVVDVGAAFPHRVAYHPTCHGLRLLGLGARPSTLLAHVRGIDLVELNRECCGFGGTFALKNPDVSAAMGADKADHVLAAQPEVLVAADNSCLTHIGGVLRRAGSAVRVMHIAEILAAR